MKKAAEPGRYPGENVFLETQVILTGSRQALIENYKNISSYTSERIELLSASGRLIISGKKLEILNYTQLEIRIRGRIENIALEEGYKK